jgi:hypothetical protein
MGCREESRFAIEPEAAAPDGFVNHSPYLLLAVPWRCKKGMSAGVAIWQRPGCSENVKRGYLRFLEQMVDIIRAAG